MAGNDTRNPDGTFAEGAVGNPAGYNGHTKGWQPTRIRLQYWYAKPASEIKAIIDYREKLESLSAIDVSCLRVVVKSMFGDEVLKAFQIAVEMIEGKPTQKTELTGRDGTDLFNDSETTVRSKIARLVAAAQEGSDTGEPDPK
jgi:hypothetical protein